MAENKKNKPWAILKVSRRQYCTARPWTRAGMSRERGEEMIAILPSLSENKSAPPTKISERGVKKFSDWSA